MYNPLVTRSKAINLGSNLTDDDIDVLCYEYDEAVEGLSGAVAQMVSLWDRYNSSAMLETTVLAQSSHSSTVSDVGAHIMAAATDNATRDIDTATTKLKCIGESFEDTNLVLAGEGFKEVLTNIWEMIQRGRRNLWMWLKKIAKKVLGRVVRLQRNVKGIRSRAEGCAGKSAVNNTIELTSGLKTLMVEGTFRKDISEVNAEYTNLCTLTRYFNGDYLTAMNKAGDNFDKVVSAIKEDDLQAGLTSLNAASKNLIETVERECTDVNYKTQELDNPSRLGSPDKVSIHWVPLPGDKVFVKALPNKTSNQTPLEESKTVRVGAYNVNDFKAKAAKVPTSPQKVPVLTISEITELCAQAEDVIRQLLKNIDKSVMDKMGYKSDKLIASTDKFVKRAKADDSYDAAMSSVVNAIPQHIAEYDSWIVTPARSLESHFCATTSALMSYASKSLSEYK